jgi:transcriptional regulator with XRE-family HTH domain
MARTKPPSQVLRDAMKAKGWDALAAAAESGVDVTLIRRYLDDEVSIGVKNAPRLADALGVDVAALLYGQRAAS